MSKVLSFWLLLLPAVTFAQSDASNSSEFFWLLTFDLTPGANGKVEKCTLSNGAHFGPAPQRQDLEKRPPPSSAIDAGCTFFKSFTLEASRNADGTAQSQAAPFPCLVRDDKPSQADCRKLPQAQQ
jgi:hypothetical protein